jgi:hypothetical protein
MNIFLLIIFPQFISDRVVSGSAAGGGEEFPEKFRVSGQSSGFSRSAVNVDASNAATNATTNSNPRMVLLIIRIE